MSLFAHLSIDLRVASNIAILPLASMVWMVGLCTLWEWKDTKPRDAKYILLCGMQSHWTNTAAALFIDTLIKLHWLQKGIGDDLITSLRPFVFVAAILYLYALTLYWKPAIWKISAIGGIALFIFAMILQAFLSPAQ